MKSEAAKKDRQQDLGLISDNVKVIQAGEPEKGKQELIQDEKRRRSRRQEHPYPDHHRRRRILLVLAILFFVKRLSELKVVGKLEYWNN